MLLAGLPDWRDTGAYAQVLAGGRPVIAWELLRRNPGYRADYAALQLGGAAHYQSATFAVKWGLHFRH